MPKKGRVRVAVPGEGEDLDIEEAVWDERYFTRGTRIQATDYPLMKLALILLMSMKSMCFCRSLPAAGPLTKKLPYLLHSHLTSPLSTTRGLYAQCQCHYHREVL